MIAQHIFMQSTAWLCEASSTFQTHGDCLCLKAVGDTLPSDQVLLTLGYPWGPYPLCARPSVSESFNDTRPFGHLDHSASALPSVPGVCGTRAVIENPFLLSLDSWALGSQF